METSTNATHDCYTACTCVMQRLWHNAYYNCDTKCWRSATTHLNAKQSLVVSGA